MGLVMQSLYEPPEMLIFFLKLVAVFTATNETKAHTPSKGESEGFQKGKASLPKAYYTQQARPGFSMRRQP